MTRLLASLLLLCSIAFLVWLGDVNVLHWKIAAAGIGACLCIAYGVIVFITNRWMP